MPDEEEREINIMVAAANSLLTGPWPDDRTERIEAKLDKVLSNHLPHLEARMSRLERIFVSKQRWAFWSGLATLLLIAYVALR